MLVDLFGLLTVCSWIYWLMAWWLVRSFFRRGQAPAAPLSAESRSAVPQPAAPRSAGPRPAAPQPAAPCSGASDFTPPVSVLKPVRGVDPGAYDNFLSFFRQDYPEYEVLFAVADESDPVVPLIRRLQAEFPERPSRLIVGHGFGPNEKACLLHYLTAAASHDVLVASDSDMRVTPDYLRRVVAPLADPGIGLVTCPYIAEDALSLPAGLEALHMGVSFLPSVLAGRKALAGRFAMGASLSVRRDDLVRLGGFGSLSDYLAEDYQIGARMAELGLKVHFSDYVMMSVLGATTFEEEMAREVRWARCARVSRPKEYPGFFLTMATPLAAVWTLASNLGSPQREALVISLLLRWLVAWKISGYTGDRESRRWFLLLPVRDLLTALVWLTGGLGRHVRWRGYRCELLEGGRMRVVGRVPAPDERTAYEQYAVMGEGEGEEEPGALHAGAQGRHHRS